MSPYIKEKQYGKETERDKLVYSSFLVALYRRQEVMKRILVIIFAAITGSGFGIDTYFTMENDAILRNDNDYTHGTKLEVVDDSGIHYMASQTMYAPDDLKQKHHIPHDRPYAGMLIGGVGYEFFQNPQTPWTHYGELDFGMIGPAAMCKDTQTMIHKLLGCKKPEGWDDQLHNEFVVNGQWWTKYNLYLTEWMALVPKGGVAAGTIQDFGELGADLKIGYNIRPTPNNEIMFSAPVRRGGMLSKLSAYVYGGASERYYLYNHMIEGTLFGHRDDDLKADIERFVTEMRVGAVVKYDRFYATYYAVFRTDEYKGQKNAPDYAGIGIGWSW